METEVEIKRDSIEHHRRANKARSMYYKVVTSFGTYYCQETGDKSRACAEATERLPGAAPVITGTLSIGPIRNERIGGSTTRAFRQRQRTEPPLRVRALVMTIGLDLPKQILNAQTEARKPKISEEMWEKCYADEPFSRPLDGLHFDDKLRDVEEPIEIPDRE
ncbi:hypothetical protein Tco_0581552 [Tanacetum coccineum]